MENGGKLEISDLMNTSMSTLPPRKNDELINWSIPLHGEPLKDILNTSRQNETILLPNQSFLGFIKPVALDSLEHKIKQDQIFCEQQKQQENKIRNELENTKINLLESYQKREELLLKELSDCKHHYDQVMADKDRYWNIKLEQKQQEIHALEQKHRENVEMIAQKNNEKEQKLISDFSSQETVWLKRITDLEATHQQQLQALTDKHFIEMNSKNLVNSAHQEATELKLKQIYDKKMGKFEKQLEEIILTHKQKELVIQGALDEARREILQQSATFTSKEAVMHEELQLKDARLISIQTKLNTLDDFIRISNMWRDTAKELATVVIQTCATVQDLPDLPQPPKDGMASVFQGFAREEEISKRAKQYNLESEQYDKLRGSNVLVQKKLLTRSLKHSKKVLDRVQGEVLPKLDNIGHLA